MRTTRLTSLVAATVAAVTVAMLPAPAAHAATADPRWSGYAITPDGTASGGFVGGRMASNRPAYRIDPARPRASTAGLSAGTFTGRLTGTGPRAVSGTDTARAAWIVSKYGDYKYGIQNAAVDVALGALLHGGAWSMNGSQTARRLNSTPYASHIRSFAQQMLDASATYAGPYRVAVSAPRVLVGQNQTVSASVTAIRTGARIRNLPVTLRYPGAPAATATTNARGLVSATFPAATAGPVRVTVEVGRLPESRLMVRTPTTTGASRIVVAGLKTTATTARTVEVAARPTVSLATTRNPMNVAEAAAGTFTMSGGHPSARTAKATFYGPFGTAAEATCDPARAATSGNATAKGSGTYALPALRVPRYGYYVWGISVPADAYNTATSTCGAKVIARVTPGLSVAASAASYLAGASVRAKSSVLALPAGYTGKITWYLYGPYTYRDNLTCGRLLKSVAMSITGRGSYTSPAITVSGTGFYAWRAKVDASHFSNARMTTCEAANTVFKVNPR